MEKNLIRALESLLDAPERITSYAATARRLGREMLQPWDARITHEIDMIRHIAEGKDSVA